MNLISLLEFSKQELEEYITKELSAKRYRVKQLLKWLYSKKQHDISKFSDIPLQLREKLQQKFTIYSLELLSKQVSKIDYTTKYIFKTYDNYTFPSVYIPKLGRNVVCISTQIGCSIGCSFCNSGKKNFFRNLTCGEIVEQVFRIEKEKGKINGILFMGMGEPLLNYENFIKSIKIFLEPEMFSLSKRKITVSTVGIVPNIYKLAEENLGIKLAISLHSYDDKKRKKFVKNLNFSVKEILNAGIFYAKKTKTKLTIEYVIIKDKNDTEEDITGLINLLKLVSSDYKMIKVNLIPYNPVDGIA
ncbi:MAG: 23S rRNA (adenine(2503)-C(2))-methyltransferase RlmN, partial [Endomicrobia bacterium]|nr:23S rRNA (adenine(2503)-C(2))-methyltransferase RlmN [Endomicrobiia bacterium]